MRRGGESICLLRAHQDEMRMLTVIVEVSEVAVIMMRRKGKNRRRRRALEEMTVGGLNRPTRATRPAGCKQRPQGKRSWNPQKGFGERMAEIDMRS